MSKTNVAPRTASRPNIKIGESRGGAALARLAGRMAADRLEAVAKEIGADLADPDQFKMCQELAAR